MGLAYQGLNRFEEAIECHEKALALKPDSAEAHTNIGLVRHRQERWEEAVACHRRAIALRPDLARARLNLGFVLLDLKSYEEAIECFEKVLAMEPQNRYARGGLLRGELASCTWRRAIPTRGTPPNGWRSSRAIKRS